MDPNDFCLVGITELINNQTFKVVSMNPKELVVEGPFEEDRYLFKFDFGGVEVEFNFRYGKSAFLLTSRKQNV